MERENGIIIGGGIGGLAAAVALSRVGIETQVFERAPEIREVGAGLTLWSNAVKALRQLGLEEPILRHGSVIERIRTMTGTGDLLNEVDFGEIGRQVGAPSLCIHRADLQRVLADAVAPNTLHTGRTLRGFSARGTEIMADFAEAVGAAGTFLIGADGIRSAVRDLLLGAAPPRSARCVAWRSIAHGEFPQLPPGMGYFLLARGTEAGCFHCGPGRVYWFVAKAGLASGTAARSSHKQEVQRIVDGWFRLLPSIVEATEEVDILRNDVIDREPTWPWGKDRITLLGDAIHPTTPTLGQGACQALEDAVVLAASLGESSDVSTGLRLYEQLRRARTAQITRNSWQLAKIFHMENGLGILVRNWLLRTRLFRWQGRKSFQKLLSHELPMLDEGAGTKLAVPDSVSDGII